MKNEMIRVEADSVDVQAARTKRAYVSIRQHTTAYQLCGGRLRCSALVLSLSSEHSLKTFNVDLKYIYQSIYSGRQTEF